MVSESVIYHHRGDKICRRQSTLTHVVGVS